MPTPPQRPDRREGPQSELETALSIVWYPAEPHRVGEVVLVFPEDEGHTLAFGRGPEPAVRQVTLWRDRPSGRRSTGPPRSPHLSRTQALLRPRRDGRLDLKNVGRCPLVVDGRRVERASVGPGELIEFERRMLLLAVQRSPWPPYWGRDPVGDHLFGEPDDHGIVGESRPAWRLRARIVAAARRPEPVLLLGARGTGRHLAARALWSRVGGDGAVPFRVDARTDPTEMAAAWAAGAIVLVEDLSTVPPALAHRIRALTAAPPPAPGPRIIAIAGASPRGLDPDLIAGFPCRIRVSGLDERKEDVPLLARVLFQRAYGSRFRPPVQVIREFVERSWRVPDPMGALSDAIDDAVAENGLGTAETPLPTSTNVWLRTMPPEDEL